MKDVPNILVTGGSGFIGSWVCKKLTEKGMRPMVFDRRTDRLHVFADVRQVKVFLGDVRDYAAVSEAVGISDGVIHLAAILGTQETIREPKFSEETNVNGSLNVFKSCAHHNKRCTYITVGNHWMNNSYSITKSAGERFALMFNKELGTKIAIVRAFNAYGPGQKSVPVRKIIPNFIIPALKNEEITIYGDGYQVMDMVYVEDVAEVLVRSLVMDHGAFGHIFEIGTGRRTTVLQVAKEVIGQVGSGKIRHVLMRPGEPEGSVVLADTSTLALLNIDVLGLVTLEDGLALTIPWYKERL